MGVFAILAALSFFGLIGGFGLKVMRAYQKHELDRIEAGKQSQLAIDAQRYEKIREILTEGILDGQPAAIEALKPLVEVVADQMRGKDVLQLKQLEHKQQLALIEARNQPFKHWMEELVRLNKALGKGGNIVGGLSIAEFRSCVQTITASTEHVFGVSLRTLPAAEEKKALPSGEEERQD